MEYPRLVATRFDRAYGFLFDQGRLEYTFSRTRKTLFVDEQGRAVLQQTRSSAADWHRTERTPRRIAP